MTYNGRTFEWARGRLLTNATRADGAEVSMTYYANGLRASKEIGDASYKYFYSTNGNLLQITTQLESGEDSDLVFVYDSTGVVGFTYNGNFYHYVRNTFGDVTDIYQSNNWVAHYTYDAFGNHTVYDPRNDSYPTHSSFIGNLNPIRYRSYFYDTDLGLYYLQSRYYDPQTGRFINADTLDYLEPESVNGLNLYCYCYNNPVSYTDPSGHAAISIGLLMAIGAIVGAVIGASASVAGQYIANGCSWENFSWGQLALDTVLGGVSGLLSMSPLGWGAMVAANAGLGFVGAVGGHLINGSDFSKGSTWLDIVLSTGLGALVGLIGGPGALNAGYLNGAKQTAGFIRVAGMYDDVLTKAVTGYYRTPGIASNALRLSSQNLVKQWNKMVVGQAGKALTKAFAYGGTALLIGTAGKGWLYDWYNDYF